MFWSDRPGAPDGIQRLGDQNFADLQQCLIDHQIDADYRSVDWLDVATEEWQLEDLAEGIPVLTATGDSVRTRTLVGSSIHPSSCGVSPDPSSTWVVQASNRARSLISTSSIGGYIGLGVIASRSGQGSSASRRR